GLICLELNSVGRRGPFAREQTMNENVSGPSHVSERSGGLTMSGERVRTWRRAEPVSRARAAADGPERRAGQGRRGRRVATLDDAGDHCLPRQREEKDDEPRDPRATIRTRGTTGTTTGRSLTGSATSEKRATRASRQRWREAGAMRSGLLTRRGRRTD